jgi:hypothetical protein
MDMAEERVSPRMNTDQTQMQKRSGIQGSEHQCESVLICGRFVRRRLHELDCCPIGIANVDNALPGIRARFEDLRLAHRAPTGRCNPAEHSLKIIHRKRNMHRSDIARSKIGTLSVRWSVIFEQLNPMPGSPENGDRNLSAGHSGDFTGEVTGMMRPMRKLEAEDILPEGQRPLEVCHRNTGVIRGDDVKRRSAHRKHKVQRPTLNVQRSIQKGRIEIGGMSSVSSQTDGVIA